MTNTRKAIDTAWNDLECLCEPYQDAQELLHRAVTASMEVERGHRGFAPPGHRYKHSASTIARYFVLRNVVVPTKNPKTWAEAALVRPDITYSRGLGQYLAEQGEVPSVAMLGVAGLRYPEDLQ